MMDLFTALNKLGAALAIACCGLVFALVICSYKQKVSFAPFYKCTRCGAVIGVEMQTVKIIQKFVLLCEDCWREIGETKY